MEHDLKDRIAKAEAKYGLYHIDRIKKKPKRKRYVFYYDSRGIDGEVIEHRISIYAFSEAQAKEKLVKLGYNVYTKKKR